MKYYLITNANMLASDRESRFPNGPKMNNEDSVYGVQFKVDNEKHKLCEGDEMFIRFRLGEGRVKVSKITNPDENYFEIYAKSTDGLSLGFRPFEIEQVKETITELDKSPKVTYPRNEESAEEDDLPF